MWTARFIHLIKSLKDAWQVFLGDAHAVGGGLDLEVAKTRALGLLLLGYGSGSWDVAMNVEGAEVERRIGRTIMPRFHAAFSLGTVVGAATGAVAAGLDVPIPWHLGVAALFGDVGQGLVLLLADRSDLPASHVDQPGEWTDYRLTVQMRSTDDDAIGLIFRRTSSTRWWALIRTRASSG